LWNHSDDIGEGFCEAYAEAEADADYWCDLFDEYTSLIKILENWKGGPIERRSPALLSWWRAHHTK